MTIQSKQPVTLAEVKEIVAELEDKQELQAYLKRFTKLKKDKANTLKKEIESLKNPKIKKGTITKIIDFLPKNAEDLNKIFTEVSFNEEEIKAILEIVKKY
jgi:DNA-directed RNA polymerase subunit F